MTDPSVPRKVLIPLDGGPEREMAITIGLEIARRMDAPAELLSIISPAMADVDETELQHEALRLRFGITGRVIVGEDVALELGQVMDESGAIVCLASSGKTAIAETVMGSVGADVIRHLHRPIIVVGPRCVPFRGTQLAIAVDGTTAGEWMIEPALALAEEIGLEPVLYQVEREHPRDLPPDIDTSSYLASLTARFERPQGPMRYEILHDRRAGRALADLTSQPDVAMLAVSSHGMQPYERLLVPSVTHHVIRHAQCPLFVGSREVPAEPPFDHGSGPRVVVGVDGSSADKFTLEFAADAAARRQATLEVVHAWPRSWYLSSDGSLGGKSAATAEHEAQACLARAVDIAHANAPGIEVLAWLVGRSASEAILEAAAGAELVVLGERRYNLIEETVLGSTTTDVLARTTTPVIVVPEPIDSTEPSNPSSRSEVLSP